MLPRTSLLSTVLLHLCLVSQSLYPSDIIVEPDDDMAWGPFDADLIWTTDPPPNASIPVSVAFSDGAQVNASDVLNATDDIGPFIGGDDSLGLIDLGFKQQLVDINSQIDAFMDKLASDDGQGNNETSSVQPDSGGPWTFVTFVTLMPLRCSAVRKIVSLFDRAMATANPGANVASIAQRLGATPCGGDGVCPCVDSARRRYTTRIMELRSRSRSKKLTYPLAEEFPYRVEIRPLAA